MNGRAGTAAVGVIGLGKMGLPIAARLVEGGFRVLGHDVHPAAVAAATAVGVEVVSRPQDVAAGAGTTLVLVGSDEELLAVVDDHLVGAAPGHLLLIGSTVAPATSLEVGRRAESVGVAVLDAALARGEAPARDGTLLVLAGGPADAFERARPLLQCIASDVHLVGGLGAGQVAKMVNNYLLWLTVVGNYEALRLASRMGVELEPLRLALLQSSGANWALETWQRPRPMPWAEADMAILLECADEFGLPMPAAGTVRELIKQLKLDKAAWLDGGGVGRSMDEMVRSVESVAT